MALFDGFLLVSDVDATLLDEKKNIPAANLAAIERFKALGGAFTIATGRTHITCEDIATRAGVNAPVVVYNGGGVYDRDSRQFLWRRMLARDMLIAPFRALMARYPDVGVEVNAGDAALMVNAGAPIDPNVLRGGFPYRRKSAFCARSSRRPAKCSRPFSRRAARSPIPAKRIWSCCPHPRVRRSSSSPAYAAMHASASWP